MASCKILSAALMVLLAAFLTPAQAADIDGKPITSILLQDDRGIPWLEPADVEPLLMVRTGDLLDRDAVRRGIVYLYLKKKFSDIQVEAVPENGGVRLEYTLVPMTLVSKVVIRGNHHLHGSAIPDAIDSVVGKELREEGFFEMRAAIQALYQAKGYYDVRVSFLPKPAEQPYRVHLYVYITEPEQTIIEQVRFPDNTVLRDEQLSSVMTNRKGRPLLTNVLLENDLSAIQRTYAEAGYLAARLGPVSINFREGKAFLDVAGTQGPRVTVTFSGNSEYSDRQLRKMLLIGTEHDVADTVIESSMDNIRTAYREQGFVDVKVNVQRTEGPGTLDLAFTVQEGPQVKVEGVRIEGNAVYTDSEIRKMMTTRGPSWYWPRSRSFNQELLDDDVETVTGQYIDAGYLEASVKVTAARSDDGSRAVIVLTVSEGNRTVTGRVSFEGQAAVSADELAAAVTLQPGTPFSERLVDEDRYSILSLYAQKGYLYTRVDAEKRPVPVHSPDSQESVIDILFRIEEDHPVTIGTVILRGNVQTRDRVILRELEPRTGEPYSYERILQSQQRIYRYGYFALAKFEPVHPNEKEYVKDMLFTVVERPAGAVEFGVGYGDLDRLRGFAEVSHRNLWGVAHYASLRLEASDILQRAAFTYRQPWFFGFRELDSKLLLAWSDAKRINQDTREIYYQTQKTTASYGVERTQNEFKTSLTYQFENVENYNVQPAAELSPEDSGRVLISSLNPAAVWDLRNDPFNPRRGSVHGAYLKEAMGILGSEAEFTKVTVQTTWFVPTSTYSVLALSGRAGRAWPHRDTAEVPIHERFYLGGSTTVRGYTQDSVGPAQPDASGDLVPTGGTSMVQLNAELRIMAPAGSGFVLFTDAGNVWINRRISLDDLRASYGAGFRYQTPVGPLRIDYGQKIHRRSGESPGELHFNVGHAF